MLLAVPVFMFASYKVSGESAMDVGNVRDLRVGRSPKPAVTSDDLS